MHPDRTPIGPSNVTQLFNVDRDYVSTDGYIIPKYVRDDKQKTAETSIANKACKTLAQYSTPTTLSLNQGQSLIPSHSLPQLAKSKIILGLPVRLIVYFDPKKAKLCCSEVTDIPLATMHQITQEVSLESLQKNSLRTQRLTESDQDLYNFYTTPKTDWVLSNNNKYYHGYFEKIHSDILPQSAVRKKSTLPITFITYTGSDGNKYISDISGLKIVPAKGISADKDFDKDFQESQNIYLEQLRQYPDQKASLRQAIISRREKNFNLPIQLDAFDQADCAIKYFRGPLKDQGKFIQATPEDIRRYNKFVIDSYLPSSTNKRHADIFQNMLDDGLFDAKLITEECTHTDFLSYFIKIKNTGANDNEKGAINALFKHAKESPPPPFETWRSNPYVNEIIMSIENIQKPSIRAYYAIYTNALKENPNLGETLLQALEERSNLPENHSQKIESFHENQKTLLRQVIALQKTSHFFREKYGSHENFPKAEETMREGEEGDSQGKPTAERASGNRNQR